MRQLFLLFFVFTFLAIGSSRGEESPLVKTGQGTLRGKFEISRNGNQYETYLGIRYAQIPRRFDESQATGTWDGIKDATEFGIHCAQPSSVGLRGEDCLHLNVFTPKADNKKRAVLVFVHGGAFNFGTSAEFGGSYLVDEDVVMVTPNYRLGTLGFLNTGDGVASGNMGLKDLVVALKWVQENIEYFGGDKSRVTISGNSAGAACVLHLMTSPLAQGLFHGVYATSGNSLAYFAFNDNNLVAATEMGEYLECNAKNTIELVACLRDAPLEALIGAQQKAQRWVTDVLRMRPTRELRTAQNSNPFLDETPEERLRKGNFAKVPVLATLTTHEGIFAFSAVVMRNEPILRNLNEDFQRIAPITFDYEMDSILMDDKDRTAQAILDFYFDGKEITREMELNLTNLYSDVYFAYSLQKMAHILGTQTSVYVGLFAHDRIDFSPLGFFGIHENVEGICHTEDLAYVFNPTGVQSPMPFLAEFKEATDIEFSSKFVNILANFVKTGVPTISFSEKPVWSPVTKDEIESNSLNWLNLDHDVFVRQNPFKERMVFWDNLYKKAHVTDQKTEL